MPGTLYVVATPIGNLEDITARALRVLREVSVIAAEDTRRTGTLLQHFQIGTPTLSLHDHNERRRTPGLIERLRAGESVALVSDAGTPLVSDPGFHLVREAIAVGLPVQPVPGPSAIMAALSVAGLPTDGFTFVGFPPARAAARVRWLEALRDEPRTLVLFETPHRIRATMQDLRTALGNREAVIARELTKLHESILRGRLDELVGHDFPIRGEFVVMVDAQAKGTSGTTTTVDSATLKEELGYLTMNGRLSRRDAVEILADRHRLDKQQIYRAVEDAND